MPKTRSGKIMRRVLAAISNRMDTGDYHARQPRHRRAVRQIVQDAKSCRSTKARRYQALRDER